MSAMLGRVLASALRCDEDQPQEGADKTCKGGLRLELSGVSLQVNQITLAFPCDRGGALNACIVHRGHVRGLAGERRGVQVHGKRRYYLF